VRDEDNRKKKAAAVIAIIIVVLVVWFLSIHHDIDVEVDGEGTVSPDGATVGHLGSVTLEFAPANGWVLKEVLLDGNTVELTDGKLVLKRIVHDHFVKAVFVEATDTYALTVTSNGHGSVSPSGTTSYPAGSEVSITATPDDGYVIDDVKVDGRSVGSKNVITVTMDSDHTVEVVFRAANDSSSGTTPADPWVDISVDVQIITTGADFGTVEPSGQVRVAYGGSLTITVTLNDGYSMVSVEVDGKPYGASPVFTVENITANISVDITVAHAVSEMHTVTASASSGGSITPSGKITVAEGQDLTFAISPNSGYKLSSLLVDGKSVGSGLASYTLKNVSADMTVRAVFESTSPSPTPGPGPSPQPVKTLVSISITDPSSVPSICYAGEPLEGSVQVTAHYSDGSTDQQTGTYGPVTWDSAGSYPVTVSYGGKTCMFNITVPELTGITLNGLAKTVFQKGEIIDLEGMTVTAHYNGASDRIVTSYISDPTSFGSIGQKTVKISYSEGSMSATAQISVTIVDSEGFSATVISYKGEEVVNGTVVPFTEEPSESLKDFTFRTSNIVPGISQTIEVQVANDTGMDQKLCIFVSSLSGDGYDVIAKQIMLSCGGQTKSVEQSANSSFLDLGELGNGQKKTFTLTMTFVENEDNNLAMGKSLTFKLGVFAGQKTEGS